MTFRYPFFWLTLYIITFIGDNLARGTLEPIIPVYMSWSHEAFKINEIYLEKSQHQAINDFTDYLLVCSAFWYGGFWR